MKAQVNAFRDRLSGKHTPEKVDKINDGLDVVIKVHTENPTYGTVYYKHTSVPKSIAIKIEAMITEHYEKEAPVINRKKVKKVPIVTEEEIKEETVLDNKNS